MFLKPKAYKQTCLFLFQGSLYLLFPLCMVLCPAIYLAGFLSSLDSHLKSRLLREISPDHTILSTCSLCAHQFLCHIFLF